MLRMRKEFGVPFALLFCICPVLGMLLEDTRVVGTLSSAKPEPWHYIPINSLGRPTLDSQLSAGIRALDFTIAGWSSMKRSDLALGSLPETLTPHTLPTLSASLLEVGTWSRRKSNQRHFPLLVKLRLSPFAASLSGPIPWLDILEGLIQSSMGGLLFTPDMWVALGIEGAMGKVPVETTQGKILVFLEDNGVAPTAWTGKTLWRACRDGGSNLSQRVGGRTASDVDSCHMIVKDKDTITQGHVYAQGLLSWVDVDSHVVQLKGYKFDSETVTVQNTFDETKMSASLWAMTSLFGVLDSSGDGYLNWRDHSFAEFLHTLMLRHGTGTPIDSFLANIVLFIGIPIPMSLWIRIMQIEELVRIEVADDGYASQVVNSCANVIGTKYPKNLFPSLEYHVDALPLSQQCSIHSCSASPSGKCPLKTTVVSLDVSLGTVQGEDYAFVRSSLPWRPWFAELFVGYSCLLIVSFSSLLVLASGVLLVVTQPPSEGVKVWVLAHEYLKTFPKITAYARTIFAVNLSIVLAELYLVGSGSFRFLVVFQSGTQTLFLFVRCFLIFTNFRTFMRSSVELIRKGPRFFAQGLVALKSVYTMRRQHAMIATRRHEYEMVHTSADVDWEHEN